MTTLMPRLGLRSALWLMAPLAVTVVLVVSRKVDRDAAPSPAWKRVGADSQDEKLTWGIQAAVRRLQVKAGVIDNLLKGRRTLYEAASLFRALDQLNPRQNWATFHRNYPGDSPEEQYCREVIKWVYIALDLAEPGENTMWPVLLEYELEEGLRRGAVQLPEPLPEDLSGLDLLSTGAD